MGSYEVERLGGWRQKEKGQRIKLKAWCIEHNMKIGFRFQVSGVRQPLAAEAAGLIE